MGGGRGEGGDALGLVHGKVGREEGGIVVVAQREDAALGVEELAHVTGEIHHRRVADGGYGERLDLVHGEVEVGPLCAVVAVAVEVDGVGLVVRAGGVIHYHDVTAAEVLADVFVVERERGVFLGLAQGLSVGVAQGPGELLHGFAEAGGQNAVDSGEHLGLALLEGGGLFTLGGGAAQGESVLAELEREDGGHA